MIPETMQAIRLHPDRSLHLETLPVPKPGDGEVLVKMAYSAINPADLSLVRKDSDRPPPEAPIPVGGEGSGKVIASGSGFLAGFFMNRRVGLASGSGGLWAEYATVKATNCTPIPASVSLEKGAMMIVNPLTCLAFMEIANKGGHRAIVNTAAAGTLGRMIIRTARSQNIQTLNIVYRQEQVEQLKSEGVEHVLNSWEPDFVERYRSLAAELNATLVLDAVAGEMTPILLEHAPPNSTVLLYGRLDRRPIVLDKSTYYLEGKTLGGFYLPNWAAKRGVIDLLRLTRQVGQLIEGDLASTIQAQFPLAQAREAVEQYLGNMTAGKVLLRCESGD